MDSKEPQIGSSSREMREERLLQSVDSSQDEISKNTSAEKSLAEPEEKNGYHNIYDKFNVKEQEIVKLVSALESIRSEIKKPMPNKEAINILLDIAMIHIESDALLGQDQQSEPFKEARRKGMRIESLARLFGSDRSN